MNEQSTRWQTGNPPEPKWYLVTVVSPHSGEYVVQAFFSKDSKWLWGDQLLGTRKDGYWPSLTTGAAVPVVAWMPLPEPCRGMGDG